jgi:hypothetical protein
MSLTLVKTPRHASAPHALMPASTPVSAIGGAGTPRIAARQAGVTGQDCRTAAADTQIVPLHGLQNDPACTQRSQEQGTTPATARRTLPPRAVEERIANALRMVAELLEHDESYLPIFLRLEAELQQAHASRAALERAKSLLQTRP